MKAVSPDEDAQDLSMTNTSKAVSQCRMTVKNAQRLSNATIEIVLERVGDPNVLPFIHVTLVFMFFMARHSAAMNLLEASMAVFGNYAKYDLRVFSET
jgi:hypothetical protein